MMILLLPSCYYDVEEELYPSLECETFNMTYSGHIEPIINANCYSCHNAASNFGNVTLEGYNALISYVNNGQLLGVIEHENGFSPMPKNQPQMINCEIEKIRAWITDGALNN